MSWKATAFVKELSHGLNMTEKFVLLMLGEYHRTDGKNEWPTANHLAEDCLITERAMKRVLSRLEEKDFIRRFGVGGRGHSAIFQIVGLDVKGDSERVVYQTTHRQTVTQTVTESARKGVSARQANKVLPVKEPIRGDIPDFSDLKPCEAALMFLENEGVCIPVNKFEVSDTEAGIEAIQRQENLSTFAALEWLLARALTYKKSGKSLKPGWVRKMGYNETGSKKPVPMVNAWELKQKQNAEAQAE